jgi:hypothetical protein
MTPVELKGERKLLREKVNKNYSSSPSSPAV